LPFANKKSKEEGGEKMTHYERPSSDAEARMVESDQKLREREFARKKMEIQDADNLYELVKDLSTERIPQDKLREELKPLHDRVKLIADIVPNLVGIKLRDYLNRTWETNIYRYEDDDDVSFGARRSHDGVAEGFHFNEGYVTYVNYYSRRIGWEDNTQVVITLVNKRLDDLLPQLEKALGLKKKGKSLSRSR
jgi:hypothetical protein